MKGGGKKKTLRRELVGSSSFLSRGRASLVNEGRPLATWLVLLLQPLLWLKGEEYWWMRKEVSE